MNSYGELKAGIDKAYPTLVQEQEAWLKEHWGHFNSQKTMLDAMVKEEFAMILGEISPLAPAGWLSKNNPNAGSAEVLDSKVEYQPPQGKSPGYFFINITKLKLPNGRVMDNNDVLSSQYGCPHIYLESVCGGKTYTEGLHPKIKEFIERYNVYHILEPENDCEHK